MVSGQAGVLFGLSSQRSMLYSVTALYGLGWTVDPVTTRPCLNACMPSLACTRNLPPGRSS